MQASTRPDGASSITNPVEAADVEAGVRLAEHREHPLVRALGTLSEAADQPPMIAATAATMAWGVATGNRRLAAAGGRMLSSVLLATAMKGMVKKLVARTRPNFAMEKDHYESRALGPDEGPWNSFPSGHTANAVGAARALARSYPAAKAPAYGTAAFAALIQIPRGAHYPLDVAAGVAVGLAAEAAVDRLFRELDVETDVPNPASPRPGRP